MAVTIVAQALPMLAAVFVAVEIFGIAAYSLSGGSVLVALVETVWVAGLTSLTMPIG